MKNQFKYKVLYLVSTDKISRTGSNYSNKVGTINISSSEINKPKIDFAKKYRNLYTRKENETLSKD